MSWFQAIQDKIYRGFRWFVSPVVRFFVRLGTPPWAVSLMGILFTLLSVAFLYRGWIRGAGAVILFAAAWDTIDGEVARAQGKESAKGAFLDSALDRLSEFVVFFGILLFLDLSALDSIMLFALLFSSLSVSYLRARAEGVGIACKVGIFDRALRVTILGASLIVIPQYMRWVILFLLLGSASTVVHRFVYVLTRSQKR